MFGEKQFALHYASAALAVLGTVGYHNLIKKIPPTIDPLVSIASIYLSVLVLGLVLMPFLFQSGRIFSSVMQLSWIQLGIAVCILAMEIGFILMYRNGWTLSVGNTITGVFINLTLMGVGVFFLHEKLSGLNIVGVLLCLIGVSMI